MTNQQVADYCLKSLKSGLFVAENRYHASIFANLRLTDGFCFAAKRPQSKSIGYP